MTTEKEKATQALRDALAPIAEMEGGRDALLKLAVDLVLPIEEKVRRENPDHPALPLIDEWRRQGKI